MLKGFVFSYTTSMIYFAHRGASALYVQNTLPSFALAQKAGATHYELDVHLTRDGQVIVHHDYFLSDTMGQERSIADISYQTLCQISLKNIFDDGIVKVPLLKDVLPVLEKNLETLNVEFKNDDNRYPNMVQKVWALLKEQYPVIFPKTLFSSFCFNTLAELRKLDKNARIGLLTREFDIRKALELSAESVHINHKRFSSEMAKICHQYGIKIYVYTVNDTALAKELEKSGADGIFTDRIHEFV